MVQLKEMLLEYAPFIAAVFVFIVVLRYLVSFLGFLDKIKKLIENHKMIARVVFFIAAVLALCVFCGLITPKDIRDAINTPLRFLDIDSNKKSVTQEIMLNKDSVTQKITPSPEPIIEPTKAPVSLRIGDSYSFGNYEQDNVLSNGAERIEWLVLSTNTEGVLLISRYVLDCVPYNESRTSITWETCTLRSWMNNTFYYQAFTNEEREGIIPVSLKNESNPRHGTRGCGQTTDRVFALSASEAEAYLTDANRNTRATAYARAQGAKFRDESENRVYWWLRTPGQDTEWAMITNVSKNELDYDGNPVSRTFSNGRLNNTGVRPSLWLKWEYIQTH